MKRLVFVIGACLVILAATASSSLQQVAAFDRGNHGHLVQQAFVIVSNDGKSDLVQFLSKMTTQSRRPTATFIQAVVDGTMGADEALNLDPFSWNKFWRHGHNPVTHEGWRVRCRNRAFASAAAEAEQMFARALDSWIKQADYDAGYWFGFASHFVQDPSVPHHAAASPDSATAKLPIRLIGCAGNGTHDLYEDWVRDNWPALPHASSGGLYDLKATGFSHSDPETAYGWSDHAAHEGFARYPEVDTVAEATCPNLPAIGGNCLAVASQLVPSAERRTAGFIHFFWQAIEVAATGFWHTISQPQRICVLSPDINPNLVTLPDNGCLPSSTAKVNWWYGVDANGTFIDRIFNPQIQTPKNGGLSTMPNFGMLRLRFDAQNIANPFLTFETWWEIESVDADSFDVMQVLIEDAQGQRRLLKTLNPAVDVNGPPDIPYSSGGFGAPGRWVQHNISLLGIPTNGIVRIIFMFQTRDSLYNGFRGWLLKRVGLVPLGSTTFKDPIGVQQDVTSWEMDSSSPGIEAPDSTDRPWEERQAP